MIHHIVVSKQVRRRKHYSEVCHSYEVKDNRVYTDGGRPRRSLLAEELYNNPFPGCTNVGQVFEKVVEQFGNRKCVAERDIIKIVKNPEGSKIPVQIEFGDYKYNTFKDTLEVTKAVSAGLNKLLHSQDKRAGILAQSQVRYHFMIEACMRGKITLTTYYSNLGDESLIFAMKESNVSVLAVDIDLVEKMKKLALDLPELKHLIILDRYNGKHPCGDINSVRNTWNIEHIKLTSFEELIELGKNSEPNPDDCKAELEDICLFMYTSGSSGVPKAVQLSHKNILSSMGGMFVGIITLDEAPDDTFLSFLPLAHIFAFQCELCILYRGGCVAYASPLTLVKGFPGLTPGCEGDFQKARPTMMAVVPLLLERIKATVQKQVSHGIKKVLFDMAFKQKVEAQKEYRDTPFWDFLLFDKIRTMVFGGRLRMFLCAGSHLLPETQTFCRVVFRTVIYQAYGLTETVCGGCLQVPLLREVGSVGVPTPCVEVRLKDWPEANYFSTDKPYPRGEILVRGDCVTMGYFNRPEETETALIVDNNGDRWFHSGDIAQWNDKGNLEIIDRKKDLVKLQHGEYLSLSKIEATLVTCKYIENICIHGSLSSRYCVALVCIKPEYTGISDEVLLKELKAVGKEGGLKNFEIPEKVFITPKAWTPDNNLVTPSFKVVRRTIYEEFKDSIDKLYSN